MKTNISVAIDGPASSGKSTAAKSIAKRMGLVYIDTGAMYRSLTLKAIERKIPVSNEDALVSLLDQTTIEFDKLDEKQIVLLDSKDVTKAIRTANVDNRVSELSSHPKIREEMVKRQQEMADSHGVIMDGRDIGTVVLPNASIKIYLNASVEERAKRRFKENEARNIETDYDQLIEDIKTRDYQDSTRQHSPLLVANDAQVIDTTNLTIEEVIKLIEEKIKKFVKN